MRTRPRWIAAVAAPVAAAVLVPVAARAETVVERGESACGAWEVTIDVSEDLGTPSTWTGSACDGAVVISGEGDLANLELKSLAVEGGLFFDNGEQPGVKGLDTIIETAGQLKDSADVVVSEGLAYADCLLGGALKEVLPEDVTDVYTVAPCDAVVLAERLTVEDLNVRGLLMVSAPTLGLPGDDAAPAVEVANTASIEGLMGVVGGFKTKDLAVGTTAGIGSLAATDVNVTNDAQIDGYLVTGGFKAKATRMDGGDLLATSLRTSAFTATDNSAAFVLEDFKTAEPFALPSGGPVDLTDSGVAAQSFVTGPISLRHGGIATARRSDWRLIDDAFTGKALSIHAVEGSMIHANKLQIFDGLEADRSKVSGHGGVHGYITADHISAATTDFWGHGLVRTDKDIVLSSDSTMRAGATLPPGQIAELYPEIFDTIGEDPFPVAEDAPEDDDSGAPADPVDDPESESPDVDVPPEVEARRIDLTDSALSGHGLVEGRERIVLDASKAHGFGTVVAPTVRGNDCELKGHDLIKGSHLRVERCLLEGNVEHYRFRFANESFIADSNVTSGHIDAKLAKAEVHRSRFSALPIAAPQTFPLSDEERDDLSSFFLHTGGSYGGYGGTEGDLNYNGFAPAPEQKASADPRVVRGLGVGGFGGGDPATEQSPSAEGGPGGGWVEVVTQDLLWDDSDASANGGDAARTYVDGSGQTRPGGGGGGGSGGSVSFDVHGQLSGNGTFHSNGGRGVFTNGAQHPHMTGGGGSGGRIKVVADSFRGFTGDGEALGGLGGGITSIDEDYSTDVPKWTDWRNHGGPGTIYWKSRLGRGEIEIDGTGLTGDGLVGGSDGTRCERCTPRVGLGRGNAELSGSFPNDVVVVHDATVLTDGIEAHSLKLENARLAPDNPRARLAWPAPDPGHEAYVVWAQEYYPSWVWETPLAEALKIDLTGGLVVDENSELSATGYGGYSRTETFADGRLNWAGGSHGGVGGTGRSGGASDIGTPTPRFGNARRPTTAGQGGFSEVGWTPSFHYVCALGGTGGGTLRIVVDGTAVVDGLVASDGSPGRNGGYDNCVNAAGTGGGAGGSVWMTLGKLVGSGVVSASGGRGGWNHDANEVSTTFGGGGGGGRIAIYGLRRFAGRILAAGGPGGSSEALGVGPGTYEGDAGTTFFKTP